MIKIENLTKRFGNNDPPAIDGLSAVLVPGRITGIVGPDGAGKTTLLRMIAGLMTPTSGRIEVFGMGVVSHTPQIREMLGYMPQRFGLYEDLTVQENLNLYAEMRGLEISQRPAKFAELLEFTGLAPFVKRLARNLSGGMKQKLGLACSLVKMPKLLLLDEPGVGVDPISRRDLWRMVRGLVAPDVVVLWNTAYLDEAQVCEEVLLMNEGKLLFHGPPDELTQRLDGRTFQVRGLAEHDRRAVLAKLIQAPAVLDGTIQGSALRLVIKRGATADDVPVSSACADVSRVKEGTCDESEITLVPVKPRFEDGFIEMLGGIHKGGSPLERRAMKARTGDAAVVVAHGLTKRFGTFTAVHDNNFSIRAGEIYGLLGPNGAGKSTTFKMLCGLLKPTEGEGFIAGVNLRTSPSKARARLGYMAQKFSMYGELTVKQNLSFYAGTYGLWGFAKRRAVAEMLEMFDLGRYANENAALLPLGFKQRLSLACALMHEPEVLFLDEPTSGVDPLTRREFWGHINALVEKGVTILVTTHFMDEAEYCDRISLIFRGETIAEGTPDALKQSVANSEAPEPTLEDAFIELIQRSESVSE